MGSVHCKPASDSKDFRKSKKEHEKRKQHEMPCKPSTDDQHDALKFLMMGIGGSGRSSLIKYYQPPLPGEPLEDFYLRSILYNLLVAMDQALGLLRESHTCEIPPEVDAWHVQNHARLPGYLRLGAELPSIEEVASICESLLRISSGFTTKYIDLAALRTLSFCSLNMLRKSLYVCDCVQQRLPACRQLLYVRTTGLRVTPITFLDTESNQTIPVRLLEVGGPRAERRKWIHFFDAAYPLLFISVMDLFCFLFEDPAHSSWRDCTLIFSHILDSPLIEKPTFVLLTHCDLLWEHLSNPSAYSALAKLGFHSPPLFDFYDVCRAIINQLIANHTTSAIPVAFYCINALAKDQAQACLSHIANFCHRAKTPSPLLQIVTALPILYPPPLLADLLGEDPIQTNLLRKSSSLVSFCEQAIVRHNLITQQSVRCIQQLATLNRSSFLQWHCESVLQQHDLLTENPFHHAVLLRELSKESTSS